MAKAVADTNSESNQGGFTTDGSNITGFSSMHDSGTGCVEYCLFFTECSQDTNFFVRLQLWAWEDILRYSASMSVPLPNNLCPICGSATVPSRLRDGTTAPTLPNVSNALKQS